jgi:ribosomal protein S12 methylthiotransferase
MKGQVSEKVKASRYHQIMALQKEISRKKQKELLGSRVTLLVERRGTSGNVRWEGRTQGQAPEVDGMTLITKGEAKPGEMFKVLITKTASYDLYGEILGPAHRKNRIAHSVRPTNPLV